MAKLFTPIDKEEFELKQQYLKALGEKYKYLLLLEGEYRSNDGEAYKTYEIITGRQATYDYIKDLLKGQDDPDCDVIIDISRSHIISEPPKEIIEKTPRITLSNMITIYAFMVNCRTEGLVDEYEAFSLEDYFDGFISDNEVEEEAETEE